MQSRPTIRSWRCLLLLLPLLAAGGCGDSGLAAREAGLQALRSGRTEEAITALEKARTRLYADPTVACNLGIAYWQIGNLELATEMLQLAADLAPSDTQALTYLVQLLGDLKRVEDAREAYQAALERHSQPTARLVTAMAVAEYRDGNSEKAANRFQQALQIDPSYPPALYNQAIVQQDLPDAQDDVIVWLERYQDVAPDGERAEQVAEWLQRLRGPIDGMGGGANGDPATPLSYTPSPADPLIVKARQAKRSEDFDTALVVLKQAAQSDPQSASAVWELASLYRHGLHDDARARETYKRFEHDFPADPRAARRLGTRTERNVQPARQAFKQGVNRFKNGQYREAIPYFLSALENDNRFVGACYYLGLAYRELDLPVRARNEFLYCLALAPDMADAHYSLGVTYRDLKDSAMALAHLRRAVELKPDHAYAHLYMGYALQEMGRNREALGQFKRFVQLAPADDPAARRMKEWLDSRR